MRVSQVSNTTPSTTHMQKINIFKEPKKKRLHIQLWNFIFFSFDVEGTQWLECKVSATENCARTRDANELELGRFRHWNIEEWEREKEKKFVNVGFFTSRSCVWERRNYAKLFCKIKWCWEWWRQGVVMRDF